MTNDFMDIALQGVRDLVDIAKEKTIETFSGLSEDDWLSLAAQLYITSQKGGRSLICLLLSVLLMLNTEDRGSEKPCDGCVSVGSQDDNELQHRFSLHHLANRFQLNEQALENRVVLMMIAGENKESVA